MVLYVCVWVWTLAQKHIVSVCIFCSQRRVVNRFRTKAGMEECLWRIRSAIDNEEEFKGRQRNDNYDILSIFFLSPSPTLSIHLSIFVSAYYVSLWLFVLYVSLYLRLRLSVYPSGSFYLSICPIFGFYLYSSTYFLSVHPFVRSFFSLLDYNVNACLSPLLLSSRIRILVLQVQLTSSYQDI